MKKRWLGLAFLAGAVLGATGAAVGPPLLRHHLPSAIGGPRLRVEGPVVLFFGLVRAYKGLDVLLRALASARHRLPIHLIVAGEFYQDRRPYERLIDELGIRDEEPKPPSDDEIRAAARRIHEREGEIEIDPGAPISHGDDPGAYVQAWVWVYFDDVKEPEEKPELPPLANPHKHRSPE